MEIAHLEQTFLEGGRIGLDREALIASGADSQSVLAEYLAKLDQLCQRIAAALPPKAGEVERARAILHWLWREKPHRYQYGGNFRLTDVLDAQMGEGDRVGNCLGLTLLYNVLGQRFGLKLRTVQLEDAFGLGPHVFSVLHAKRRSIDIENVFPYGFDYRGHRENPQRQDWGDRELVADIYHSRANGLFEQGELEGAVENYDKALRLNPRYIKARLNKGIALVELGRVEQARDLFRG